MAKSRRSVGRPAAGVAKGEKTSEYPVLAHRIPKDAIDTLKDLAAAERRPQWRVLVDAITERAKRLGVRK